MKYYFALLVIVLAAGLGNGKAISSKLSACNQEDEGFYPGKTYSFNYYVNASVGIKTGNTIIDCGFNLKADKKCHYTLRVESCSLSEANSYSYERHKLNSDEFKEQICRYPIEFSMSNGSVSGLLAHKDELTSVLNFKRGMITSLLTKKYPTKQDRYSNDHTEPRTDVQGTCQVAYLNANGSWKRPANFMRKDISKCDFPTREHRGYNPVSLIWNTAPILRPLLGGNVYCKYGYNSDGILESNICTENYIMPGQIFTLASVQVDIVTSLALKVEPRNVDDGTSIQYSKPEYDPADDEYWQNKDKASYISYDIQYEYEKEIKSEQDVVDIYDIAPTLLTKFSTDPDKPVDAQSVNAFDELVDLLRKSSHKSFQNINYSVPSNFTSLHIQVAQIWISALIHCNRAHCTHGLKEFISNTDPKLKERVVRKTEMESIFKAWKSAHIYDFEHVKDILEIAVNYTYNRRIMIESSAILYNYWKHEFVAKKGSHQQQTNQEHEFHKVSDSFEAYVAQTLDKDCNPTSGYKHIDAIASLRALANIAPTMERNLQGILQLIEKCIHNKKAHFAISSVAIGVTSHMRQTLPLYEFLMKIFNDPTLKHVDHVAAYYILAEKFGGDKLVVELLEFLASADQKGYDYNLRTFIVTHMRAVAKNRYPDRRGYSRAIREAMVYNSSLFWALPDQISPKKFDTYFKGFHLDDDLYFRKGLFSKYFEEQYSLDSQFFEGLGLGLVHSILHNEDSYLPYAEWADISVRAFGKSYNLLEREWITADINSVETSGGDKNVPDSLLHFPYKIDSKVITDLLEKHVHKTPTSTRTEWDSQVGLFDDLISILKTQGDVRELPIYEKIIYKIGEMISNTNNRSSQYWKFIEGCTTIPTLTGLAMDFPTDAHFISNSKFEKDQIIGRRIPDRSKFEVDASFSGLISIKQALHLDLKGFRKLGIQQTSTISTSVGVIFNLENMGSGFIIRPQIELPQRPMTFLSLKRNIFLINDNKTIDYQPYGHVDPVTENECSNTLASLLGIKLCKRKSFTPGKHCSLLTGKLDYTSEYIADHKAALQFRFESNFDDNWQPLLHDVEIFVKSRDQKDADKFNTLVRVSNHINFTAGEFKTNVEFPTLPAFNIKALGSILPNEGLDFKSEATVYPGNTLHLEYLTQHSIEDIIESTLSSHMVGHSPITEPTGVPTTTTHLNITFTGPRVRHYGFEHKFHKFPLNTYADYKFVYDRPLSSYFSHPFFWEEDGTGWIKIRREVKEDRDHQCYTHIKLPKTTVKLTNFHGAASLNKHAFNFNLTKHHPHTDEVLDFVKFKSSAKHTTKDGKMSYVLKANASVPSTSFALQLRHDDISPINHNYTLILRKEEPYHKEHELESSDNVVQHSEPKISSFRANYRDSIIDTFNRDQYSWFYAIDVPFGRKEYCLNLKYHEDEGHAAPYELDIQSAPDYVKIARNRTEYHRGFSIHADLPTTPPVKFRFDSTWYSDRYNHLYKARFGSSSQNHSYYTFNVTRSQGAVYMTADFTSELVKSHYSWTSTPHIEDIVYRTKSDAEPLLDLDFKLFKENSTTSLKIEDELEIIDLEWTIKDYFNGTAYFKSEHQNLAPNMRWKAYYPSDDHGVTFKIELLDISEEFYISAHTELNATRLVFDVCHKKKCTKSDIDSEIFVAEIELSLENPEKLTRTVIYNPKSIKFVKSILKYGLEKFAEGVHNYFQTRTQRSSLIRYYFETTNKAIRSASRKAGEFFLPFAKHLSESADDIIDPFLHPINKLIGLIIISSTSYQPSTASCYFNDLKLSYNPNDYKNQWYHPGPILGQSYVDEIALPLYSTKFKVQSTTISPTFVSKLRRLRQKFVNDGTLHLEAELQDSKYSRHGFFSSYGDIYTFDDRIIHLSESFNNHSSYLLSHDSAASKFVILYNDSSIEFIFPAFKLTINPNGTVMVNGTTRVELPCANWKKTIHATRKGDLIEVITPYDMKAICRIEHFYCIFYTNLNTFNNLIGLLGNNNGNPADDSDNDVSCEQEERIPCNSSKYEQDHALDFLWEWYYYVDSPTLACHNIISLEDFFSAPHLTDPNVQATLEDGYLALCRAKNVPTGRSELASPFILKERGFWESKVNDGVDVIFVLELEYWNLPEEVTNGMMYLAEEIVHQWQSVGQANISFGLVGYKGSGYRHAPHQYTMNGSLLGTYEEFINTLKTVELDGPQQRSEDNVLAALEHAVGYYKLREKSHHVFIVSTPSDSVATQGSRIRKLTNDLLHASVTLHALSHFHHLDASRVGYNFAHKEQESPLDEYSSKGVLASIAAATEGAIWQTSKLEDSPGRSPMMAEKFAAYLALAMYGNGEKQASQCRQCMSSINNADREYVYCERKPCDFTKQLST